MSKLFLVDLGYFEDTVVYELVPKEVLRFKQAPLKEVENELMRLKMNNLVVDSALPREIDDLKSLGFNIIKGRLPNISDIKRRKTMSIYETHKPAQGKGDYLKLKDGDRVKVRFASEPAVVTYDGKRIRYQWIVYNRNDKKAQIYEAGAQVFGQLADLYPEWGEPTKFDVTISRTGSGQFDTSYTVTPSPKSVELTADEKTLVDKVAENFPGSKSRWLTDLESDGVMPEALKPGGETTEDAPPITDEDLPPDYR